MFNAASRSFVVIGLVIFAGLFIYVSWLWGTKAPLDRAKRILSVLSASLGIQPIATTNDRADFVSFMGAPPQTAAGVIDGSNVVIKFFPKIARSSQGRTMLSVACPRALDPSFGWAANNYGDLAPAIKTMIASIPHAFERAYVSGQNFIMEWRGLETDPIMIKKAVELAAFVCAEAK
jgi:hypothetical protein